MPLYMTNRAIVNAEGTTITTEGLSAGGYLQPYQAKKFIQHTFEATPLLGLVRHEMRVEKTGEIDKIGIGRRLLRAKTENVDDGYRAGVNHGKLTYATKAVRLPWEITEETLRENIEGQNYESIVEKLMTAAVGVDSEDLYLNGDESTDPEDPDYDFLKLDNGWVKQISDGGHVIDRTNKFSGSMSLDVFYDALRAVPNKYNNGKLRWLMSPHRKQEWERYILKQAVEHGGIITDKRVENPAAVPAIEVPNLADDKVLLVDPKNLGVVNSYSMKIRKTTEGESAIMQDKRFYVIHFDFDTFIEELNATCIITGLAAI